MRIVAIVLLLAGCGGSASRLGGNWTEELTVPGSGAEMSLTETGSAISGDGVQHVEAGIDISFSISGTASEIVFTYSAQIEHFTPSMPDPDHLLLSNPDFTRHFQRR